MGCAPSGNPDTSNQCTISLNDHYHMHNFCVQGNNSNNSYRTSYCSQMSSAGEWISVSPTDQGQCAYGCTSLPIQCQGAQCTNENSGWGNTCERVKFTGDPITCCLNDFNCKPGSTGLCFSDAARQNTCSDGLNGTPDYRQLTGTGCQDYTYRYCLGGVTGDNPNDITWLNRWAFGPTGITGGTCPYIIKRNLIRNTSPCGPVVDSIGNVCNLPPITPYDSEGFFWAQSLVTAAMAKYNAQGFNLGVNVGDVGYTPWQEIIYDLCCKYPGICQEGLQTICANRTTARISLNPKSAQWCGCHLPTPEYEDYAARFNIPPQCSSICNRSDVIPITGINGDPITCLQNVCIIDDVTVNVVSSQIGGGIVFGQVCANCPIGGCSCIVSNTTVDIANSTIGGVFMPVSEGCGTLNCQQTNPGRIGSNTIPTPCSGSYNPFQTYDEKYNNAQTTANKNSWLWTILIVAIFLVILFLVVYFFSGSKKALSQKPIGKTQSSDGQWPTVLGRDGRVLIETPVPNPQLHPRVIHVSSEPFLNESPSTEKFI